MKNKIKKTISAIKKARAWELNVKENSPYAWRTELVNIQRDLEDIDFALDERPSVAAYGESQMGKSYLITAMLSESGSPFCINDGNRDYDFLNEINPSEDNSSIEATGLVTRFTQSKPGQRVERDWLKVQMLSVADIVLILTEAWCNEVIRHNTEDPQDYIDKVHDRENGCQLQECANPILSEVDFAYMDQYLRDADSSSGFSNINSSKLLLSLREKVGKISNESTISLLKLLWEENPDFNRLFDDLLQAYREIGFPQTAYVEFNSVLKKHGSLLDVERLNEMYGQLSPRVDVANYIRDVSVRIAETGRPISVSKPFLSALVSELCVNVDSSVVNRGRPFLNEMDILDFPGLRPKDERDVATLDIGDNLATVYRRGKVTYLFKKYSRSKRICSLLFCHNHNQSNACKLGPVVTEWVNANVGKTPAARWQAKEDLGDSPLMLVSTWFNENLKYSDERRDSDLNKRWETRFRTVLTNQVLKAQDLPAHWFNSWDDNGSPFRSIFLLRSFKFSKTIFEGYDPEQNKEENGFVENAKFPDFLDRLKDSFMTNKFVRERFDNPAVHWDACATPANDGTKPIIDRLNKIAPKAMIARQKKFERDFNELHAELNKLLSSEYHDDDPAEQTRKAKKEVGKIIVSIDRHCGNDPYFWSRLLESMMIPERLIRETVFSQIKGKELSQPMSKPESEIFMAAGLDTNVSVEENLRRLCAYLGADDRNECEEILHEIDPEIDIDKLLKKQNMVESSADLLLTSIERLWQEVFLSIKVAGGNSFSEINAIVAKLVSLYRELDVHKMLVQEIQHLMDTIVEKEQVGIVSSWLTMSLNKFVGEFGYSYMNEAVLRSVAQKNTQFGLNIDMGMLDSTPQGYGIELLKQMDSVQRSLEQKGFTSEVREQQKQLPQYRGRWQWQNRMRAAFAVVSGLRDYNIDANNEIKCIIDSIN